MAFAWRSISVAAIVGLAAGVMLAQQSDPAAGSPHRSSGSASGSEGKKPGEPWAKWLRDAVAAHEQLRDYTCTFTRQMVRSGELSAEETAHMQVRLRPRGVRVRFAHPPAIAGMEVAYTEAARDGCMRYRLAGSGRGFLRLSFQDPKFLETHRYPVTEWTIGALLARLQAILERERLLRNPVEAFAAAYHYAGRDVTRWEIHLRRPHALRPAAKLLVFLDDQTHLPLRYEAYGEATPGKTPPLLEMFSYTDIRTNVSLTEKNFAD